MNRVAGVSEAPPQLNVFWPAGDEEFTLSISPSALREIKGEVVRGFKAIPRRGAEVGGLLRGTIQRSAGQCRIHIKGAKAVPIEYRYGPSYRLSELDERLFQQTLNQGDQHPFVGWYRSNTRVQKLPDETDRIRSARCFGNPESIFLLLRPDASGVISA